MGDRLSDRNTVVVGAGQTPGGTVGNGRAIALLFARQGARVMCVDRVLDRAQETAAMIVAEGGSAIAFAADVADRAEAASITAEAVARFGSLHVLVNNVGIGAAADGPAHLADEDAFDRIVRVNLTGMWQTIRAAIPVMRASAPAAIVNISSLASLAGHQQVAYEVSKAAVNRLTLDVAGANAKYGVRCNAILPGLMDTPMAVDGIALASGRPVDEIRDARSAQVPLRGGMGTAWDTAHAALFLASSEASFITGVLLPVDGGMSARVG